MRIDKYKNLCDNVQISDQVLAGYQNAIDQIKTENDNFKSGNKPFIWREFSTLSKVAIIFGVFFVLSGSTFLSVKAYMNHMEKLRNIPMKRLLTYMKTSFSMTVRICPDR